MAYQSYRDLIAWQKAMDLAVDVYQFSENFPADERFGLTSQIRRAAVSVPSNISEGHGRRSQKEFSNFLWIANGSLAEIQTQAILAQRLGYVSAEAVSEILSATNQIGRLVTGLRNSLDRQTNQLINQSTNQLRP